MTSEEKRKALERRRLQAGRLLRKGVSKAEVARRLGVAPSTVTGWAQRLERGGLEAIAHLRLPSAHRRVTMSEVSAPVKGKSWNTRLRSLNSAMPMPRPATR